jgi:uncharacterized membrane protein YdjX (TVP38/TMEM64 family)
MKRNLVKIAELSLLALLVALTIWFTNQVGIEQVRSNINQLGIWAPLIVLLLRLTSIVIPVLPGTAYSILAGALFGFWQGLIVIAIADLIACTANFWIAKRYGRDVVQKMVGERFMGKVDRLSRRYLESNFFLLTGVMMTGLFDFVCYAVGLTKMSWRNFMGALSLSIVIAKPPIVAIGAGIFAEGNLLLGGALLGTFALAIITGWLKRNQNLDDLVEERDR